jgi:hypothetical protein
MFHRGSLSQVHHPLRSGIVPQFPTVRADLPSNRLPASTANGWECLAYLAMSVSFLIRDAFLGDSL